MGMISCMSANPQAPRSGCACSGWKCRFNTLIKDKLVKREISDLNEYGTSGAGENTCNCCLEQWYFTELTILFLVGVFCLFIVVLWIQKRKNTRQKNKNIDESMCTEFNTSIPRK